MLGNVGDAYELNLSLLIGLQGNIWDPGISEYTNSKV